jgi:putative endopeptidase
LTSKIRTGASALALAAALAGFGPAAFSASPAATSTSIPDLTAHSYGAWGFDLSGRDTAVRPGDDFFTYANGAYIQKTEIPADRSWYGTVNKLRDLSEARVHAILEDAAAKAPAQPAAGDVQGKIGAFYKAFMNEAAVEALDTKPLAGDLGAIRAAGDRSQLAAVMGQAPNGFQSSLFDIGIDSDLKDSDRYAVYIDQGGLGMPDRDYYLKPEFASKKQAYQAYVAKMLGMIGWADAEANAKAIVDFESKVAEAAWPKADRRDPEKIYNPMTKAELVAMAPGFDWNVWLAGAQLGGRDKLVIQSKSALPTIAALYASTPLDTLKAYMAFHLVDDAAGVLPKRFVEAKFDFDGRTLSGQPEMPVRWKRGVRSVSGALGEAIGQVYVARYFPPEAKAKMAEMVGNLKEAYRARIQRLDWMSPETKTKALEKLANFDVQIGYPKKWKDYSTLQVSADDLYGDGARGIAWRWDYQLARLNLPVDRDQWDMTPQTVNAYNQPTFNEVVFPAAILQPPVFDPKADPAVNYGAIGAVIGHEMSHGFDDEGRKFDSHGRLANWWTAQDAQRFVATSKAYGAQFEKFPIMEGFHIKGDLTMGENIADLAGVLAALDAYHASLKGKPAPVIDGLTGDQRFFLAYAQYYRNKWRDDMMRQLIVSDPHSPDKARVDVVLPNVDGWYQAWGVKPGDKLYLAPEQRVRIW